LPAARAPHAGPATFPRLRSVFPALCATLLVLACAGPSRADLIFSGSSGSLSAMADFSLSVNTLTVTLTNTSGSTALVPTDVLTGVFFNSTHTLTPVSATLPSGTVVYYGSLTNAGDGWGYATGVSAQGMNSAISATGAVNGLGHSNFSGANNALQGLDYGLLPAGYTGVGANTGITGHGPLVKDSVVFTLTVPTGFSLSELGSEVVFQYGTSLSETHFTGSTSGGGDCDGGGGGDGGGAGPGVNPSAVTVPEPSSVILFGMGLAGLAGVFRRRRAGTAA
jgi:hypothetical protein